MATLHSHVPRVPSRRGRPALVALARPAVPTVLAGLVVLGVLGASACRPATAAADHAAVAAPPHERSRLASAATARDGHAESGPSAATRLPPGACEGGSDARRPECAPDQGLALDAGRPTRRFASYVDLVTLVRGNVGVGLVLAPFTSRAAARVRFDVELRTRWRAPRGFAVTARVGAALWGSGLDGLALSVVGRYSPMGQRAYASVGMELGLAHRFHALVLAASVGADVAVWSEGPRRAASPSVRLLLGHAFY